jgi:hypothetical protein
VTGKARQTMRVLTLWGTCLAALLLCGCSTGPTTREVRAMGPIQVVFLQSPGNVVALDRPYPDATYFLGCVFADELVAGVTCESVVGMLERFRHDAVKTEQARLAVYAGEIKMLDFNDKTYAMFNMVSHDTPWLRGNDVARVPWLQDGTAYARQLAGDTVVYVQPLFAMTRDSNDFLVYFVVAIQKFDPSYPNQVYDFRMQEFSFVHEPIRLTPDMGMQQRIALRNGAVSMDPEKAMQLWFSDDSALLREDFAQDLKQVDQDIRKMLGSRPPASSTHGTGITP